MRLYVASKLFAYIINRKNTDKIKLEHVEKL